MRKRYTESRAHGHGRVISMLHAPKAEDMVILAAIIGFIIGVLL